MNPSEFYNAVNNFTSSSCDNMYIFGGERELNLDPDDNSEHNLSDKSSILFNDSTLLDNNFSVDNLEKMQNYSEIEMDFLEYASMLQYDIHNDLSDNVVVDAANFIFDREFSDKYYAIQFYLLIRYNLDLGIDAVRDYIFCNPTDVLQYLNFPFRKIYDSEVGVICSSYKEEWYMDFVLPLFSFEEVDTRLLLMIMKQHRFDQNLFLEYSKDKFIFNVFLQIYCIDRFDKDLFEWICTKNEIEISKIVKFITNNPDISTEILIIVLQECYDTVYNFVTTYNGECLNDDLRKLLPYRNEKCFKYIVDTFQKGYFSKEIIENYLIRDKSLILSKIYYEDSNVFDNYDKYKNFFAGKIISDMRSFYFPCNDFIERYSGMFNDYNILFYNILFYRYSGKMTLPDYKKWLILLIYDCDLISQMVTSSKLPINNFTKYWMILFLDALEQTNISIPDNVGSSILVKTKNSYSWLDITEIIFSSDKVIKSLNQIGINSINFVEINMHSDTTESILCINTGNNVKGITLSLQCDFQSSLDYVANNTIDDTLNTISLAENEILLKYNLLRLAKEFKSLDTIGKNNFKELVEAPMSSYCAFDKSLAFIKREGYSIIFSKPYFMDVFLNIPRNVNVCTSKYAAFFMIFYNTFQKQIDGWSSINITRLQRDFISVEGLKNIKEIDKSFFIEHYEVLKDVFKQYKVTLRQDDYIIVLTVSRY